LAYAKSRGTAIAVLFLDINDFKQVNDQHGHETGDKLLRIVAKRLSRSLRSDDVVSRLDGDEFACMLANNASRDHIGDIAAKLFTVVSTPAIVGPLRLAICSSMGIALFPADGLTPDTLLQQADAAMYYAKQTKTGFASYGACSPRPTHNALQI
jgi:diguanylate cyclase (GGDEF)-like protein